MITKYSHRHHQFLWGYSTFSYFFWLLMSFNIYNSYYYSWLFITKVQIRYIYKFHFANTYYSYAYGKECWLNLDEKLALLHCVNYVFMNDFQLPFPPQCLPPPVRHVLHAPRADHHLSAIAPPLVIQYSTCKLSCKNVIFPYAMLLAILCAINTGFCLTISSLTPWCNW